MSVFKKDFETKRVIFNVRLDLAMRLEKAKEEARILGRKLDVDSAIDKALEKFLKKAEKEIAGIQMKNSGTPRGAHELNDVQTGVNASTPRRATRDPKGGKWTKPASSESTTTSM
jgi:hypothetical protein